MATVSIFGIYDLKAKAYQSLFPAPNAEVALRMFSETSKVEGTNLALYPEDFALDYLGVVNHEERNCVGTMDGAEQITTGNVVRVLHAVGE